MLLTLVSKVNNIELRQRWSAVCHSASEIRGRLPGATWLRLCQICVS